MSEGKLYAVKNDEGRYWNFSDIGFWPLDISNCPTTNSKKWAEQVANNQGGHVVTLVEEPEKVTVSQNEAKAIESLLNANTYAEAFDPFQYLFASRSKEDINRLLKAIKNGYTVANEKKYLVYKVLGGKQSERNEKEFAQAYRSSAFPGTMYWAFVNEIENASGAMLTQEEIKHYGLQDCEKEEVADDEQ